jgi:hypothetical protein
VPVTTDREGLIAAHKSSGIRITPATAVTRWTGEALDFGLAIDLLLQQRRKKRFRGNV